MFFFAVAPATGIDTSFPTRRSSDLGRCRAAASRRRPGREWHRPTRGRARASRQNGPRSEEHTSELQSQSNLVCRLLLEKKKLKKKMPTLWTVLCETRWSTYVH